MRVYQLDECINSKRLAQACEEDRFPNWEMLSLDNVVVELAEDFAEVWKVTAGNVGRVGFVSFVETDWQVRLEAILRIAHDTQQYDN